MCGTPLPTPCIDRPACKRPCRPEKPYAVPEKIGDGAESRQTDLNGIPDKPCRKWRTVVWTGQFQYNPPQNDNGECNSERNEKVDSVFLPGWLAEKDTDQETQIQPAGSDQPIGQRQSAKCQPEQTGVFYGGRIDITGAPVKRISDQGASTLVSWLCINRPRQPR